MIFTTFTLGNMGSSYNVEKVGWLAKLSAMAIVSPMMMGSFTQIAANISLTLIFKVIERAWSPHVWFW
jgi:hypothetical protein